MNQNRRKFFKIFGAGAVGFSLTSFLKPNKANASIPNSNKNIENSDFQVKIHPQSVKRTKKG